MIPLLLIMFFPKNQGPSQLLGTPNLTTSPQAASVAAAHWAPPTASTARTRHWASNCRSSSLLQRVPPRHLQTKLTLRLRRLDFLKQASNRSLALYIYNVCSIKSVVGELVYHLYTEYVQNMFHIPPVLRPAPEA